MVESGTLLRCCPGNWTLGSNPSLSVCSYIVEVSWDENPAGSRQRLLRFFWRRILQNQQDMVPSRWSGIDDAFITKRLNVMQNKQDVVPSRWSAYGQISVAGRDKPLQNKFGRNPKAE